MAQIKVYLKGDKNKGIEGTGQERMMGETQFEKFGKTNGWAKVPSTPETKTETGTDSDKDDNKGGNADKTAVDFNAKPAVIEIKKMGEAGDLDKIKAFISTELTSDAPRSTVLEAADKYLKA